MTSYKRMKVLLVHLEAEGATIKPIRDGWQVLCKGGGIVTMHKDPGTGNRAEQNLRSVIKRHGHTWPFDGRK